MDGRNERLTKYEVMVTNEPYNQQQELEKITRQLEQESLMFNPNSFPEEDIEEKMYELRRRGYSEQQIQRLLPTLEPTSLEGSIKRVIQENPQVTLEQIAKRYAPALRKRVRRIAKELLRIRGSENKR